MMRQSSKSSRHLGSRWAGLAWNGRPPWRAVIDGKYKLLPAKIYPWTIPPLLSALDCSIRGPPPIIDRGPPGATPHGQDFILPPESPCFWRVALSQLCGRHVEMLLVQLNVCIRQRVSRRDRGGHSIISPLCRAGDLRRPATTRAGNEPSRSLMFCYDG